MIILYALTGIFLEDSHADRLTIVPHLDLEYQHDSNYFKAENGEKSVGTYIFRPGIDLGYVTAKSSLSLNYSAEVNQYSGEDNISDYDYVGHKASLAVKSQVSNRLTMAVLNDFIKTRDPASSDEFNNDVTRNKYTLNRFTPGLLYQFGDKFSLGVKFTNLRTDYSEGISEDSNENRGTFTLTYNLNHSTAVDIDYQVWDRDYEGSSSDYTSNQAMFNLKKKYKYLTFKAGAGYHAREFDHSDMNDLNAPTWVIGVKGQTGSSSDGTPKSWIDATLNQNYNDSGSGDFYYKATKFSASLGHVFMERLKMDLKGFYQFSDYDEGPRKDNKWALACRTNYAVNKVFSLAVEPGFESRQSNEAGKDYDNTYILFNINVRYDLGGKNWF
ncbi:outer membrane beta-barrel protein [Desulfocicer vacuolatum]|uniref:outer membrane beta-barrel protein n=1 Tax=Desulfocicer vacuolatum TaxID=2298 RepID=UPI001BB066B9|nr:outer membrane beta-barrel protein [Desulfocicer vacuolatum]